MTDGTLKPQFRQFLAAAQDSRRSHLENVFAAMFVKVVRAKAKPNGFARPAGPPTEEVPPRGTLHPDKTVEDEP